MALYRAGAIGYSGGGMTEQEALQLWAAGRDLGHDRVLDAVRTAAERVEPPAENTVQAWFRVSKDYWEIVSALLGGEAAGFPPYFRWPSAPASGAGR